MKRRIDVTYDNGIYEKDADVRIQNGYEGKRSYTPDGFLPMRPLSYEDYKIRRVNPTIRGQLGDGSIVQFVNTSMPFFPPNDVVPRGLFQSTRDEAIKKLWAKLANTNSLLPMLLIERKETIDMCTKYVMGLVRFRRNFLKELRRVYKGNDNKLIHEKWLEYRYGWLPFLSDVNTLLNQELGLPSIVIRSSHSESYSVELKEIQASHDLTQFGMIRYRCIARVKPEDAFAKTAAQYGLSNPALVAWELVPMSFVVDWFLDVGGYLEHLGALSGLTVTDACVSHEHRFAQAVLFDNPSKPGGTNGLLDASGVLGGRSIGLPSYPNPFDLSNGLNLNRFFDALALLRAVFRK